MRRKWLIFVAAMTTLNITACGSGDGIVINGTTAAEAESDQLEEEGSAAGNETSSGTKIEIVTGETTAPFSIEETAAPSTEGWTEAAATQPETTAPPQTQSTTKAAVETTAAKKYNVSDVKKTMYATASVRVRSSYSTSSDVLAALADGEKVDVTGQVENGWMRVSYKGHTGYVSGSYLSETPPATKSSTANTSGQGNTQTKPSTTTGTGTTPGTTTGPVSNNNSGGTEGPSAGTSSGTANPGDTGGPSAGGNSNSANPGGAASGQSSVSGTVTSLDPSGVTVKSSNGTSYQFVWGSNPPDLVAGDQVNISYETTSSGEKKITSVSK